MGLLDDAIREHLELKRRHGAAEEEVTKLQAEALGAREAPQPQTPDPAPAEPPAAEAPPAEPPLAAVEPELPEEPAVEIPVAAEPEPWLDEPDEVPFEDALDHRRPQPTTTEFSAEDVAAAHGEEAGEYVAPDEEPGDDLLEETPDFLQETPEHDRLWFEQKPPRDFDFGS